MNFAEAFDLLVDSMPETTHIQDSFGRVHNYLRIALTERCNLRCTYCMPVEGVQLSPKASLMTADEIVELAKVFVGLGVNRIRLTGGEPLVRKDVGEIMERLGRLPVDLTLTTNAYLADRFIDTFKSSGVRSLNVSLDTLKEDRFRQITRRDGWAKTMENIRLLMDNGIQVKVNAVLMRDVNEDELIDFIEWTRATPVQVRFIEFMPFDGNRWEWDKIVPYKEIMEQIQSTYSVDKLEDAPHATTKAYQVKGFQGTFAVISSMTEHFCGSCNRMRLTANGRMKNCLFSNDETDLLTPFRAGENIQPLIDSCVQRKKAKHGGIKAFENLSPADPQHSERSMILIGG